MPPGVLHLLRRPNNEAFDLEFRDDDNSSTCFAVSMSTIIDSVDGWNSTLMLWKERHKGNTNGKFIKR